ncbi:MAG TPA: alpha/beta fold hydrolase [Solirubrobacteraceae bacterium]
MSVPIAHEAHGSPTDRPPLLLTHGYGQSGRMWEPNVPALARDRLVITWDLPGHGESEERAEYSHRECLAAMGSLLDGTGAERAVLGGQSLGGFLSLRFALEHPDRVAALVLVEAGPGFRDDEARERWNDAARSRDDGPVHELLVQRDGRVFEGLDDISAPTLVVVGSEDALFLPASEVMERRIAGARRVVLEGAGHMANADAPNEFNAAVSEFLEEL